MKKHLLPFAVLSVVCCLSSVVCSAQTNVSGGIYANTTWSKVNSPYVVIDTVVVFPGVTLTIEPGVVVKFADNKRLEIRQAKLVAVGTAVDSITFTSNSGNPYEGSWGDVFINGGTQLDTLKLIYTNFWFATSGVHFLSQNTVIIRNSRFTNNINGFNADGNSGGFDANIDTVDFVYNTNYGISFGTHWRTQLLNNCNASNNYIGIKDGEGVMKNCIVHANEIGIDGFSLNMYNCSVRFNQTGITNSLCKIENCIISDNSIAGIIGASDTVANCQINNNGIGFHDLDNANANCVRNSIIEYNTIGIKIEYALGTDLIFGNKICNNSMYNLYYNVPAWNTTFPHNYWCSSDSATVAATIYDGHDNLNLGLVNFMPFDTAPYNAGNCSANFMLIPDTIQHHFLLISTSYGTGSLNYNWTWGDGTSNTGAFPNHTYPGEGQYTICLSIVDSVGCPSTYCYGSFLDRTTNTMVYVNVVAGIGTGISSPNSSPAFSISPNPGINSITITIDETMLGSTLTIYDITGKKMTTAQLSTVNRQLSTENFASGIYFVTLENEKGRTTKKLVIEK